jgi:hypothetical protein
MRIILVLSIIVPLLGQSRTDTLVFTSGKRPTKLSDKLRKKYDPGKTRLKFKQVGHRVHEKGDSSVYAYTFYVDGFTDTEEIWDAIYIHAMSLPRKPGETVFVLYYRNREFTPDFSVIPTTKQYGEYFQVADMEILPDRVFYYDDYNNRDLIGGRKQ